MRLCRMTTYPPYRRIDYGTTGRERSENERPTTNTQRPSGENGERGEMNVS
jgi:hypothetical protein